MMAVSTKRQISYMLWILIKKMLYAIGSKNVLKISVYPFFGNQSFGGGKVPHLRSVRVYKLQVLF